MLGCMASSESYLAFRQSVMLPPLIEKQQEIREEFQENAKHSSKKVIRLILTIGRISVVAIRHLARSDATVESQSNLRFPTIKPQKFLSPTPQFKTNVFSMKQLHRNSPHQTASVMQNPRKSITNHWHDSHSIGKMHRNNHSQKQNDVIE